MGERTRYEPGTFCLVGLATSDPAPATGFYASLFGWDSEERSAGEVGGYTMMRRGGREVAILYRQTPEARAAGAPPHWTSYISVEDADATVARSGELGGGAVFREPFDVLNAGRVAAIRAPTGAIVSLWQPRSLIGAALVNEVGAWCWNELATTDVERARAFFGELLDWQYGTDERGYVSIKNAGRLNGGMREQTEHERGMSPNWLPYFTVEDAEAAARQAEELGGRGLSPTTEIHIGRFAVIADPQGAAFAVLEARPTPSGNEAWAVDRVVPRFRMARSGALPPLSAGFRALR
jgi:predicted enzyme related to lactoylglutathione lyase